MNIMHGENVLLEGNLCNFERKFIMKDRFFCFSPQNVWKHVQNSDFLTILPGNVAFFLLAALYWCTWHNTFVIFFSLTGMDVRSEPCQRFFRDGLTTSFTKILTDEAVSGWKFEIHVSGIIDKAILLPYMCPVTSKWCTCRILHCSNI